MDTIRITIMVSLPNARHGGHERKFELCDGLLYGTDARNQPLAIPAPIATALNEARRILREQMPEEKKETI